MTFSTRTTRKELTGKLITYMDILNKANRKENDLRNCLKRTDLKANELKRTILKEMTCKKMSLKELSKRTDPKENELNGTV